MVMVCGKEGASFSRIWCSFELHYATDMALQLDFAAINLALSPKRRQSKIGLQSQFTHPATGVHKIDDVALLTDGLTARDYACHKEYEQKKQVNEPYAMYGTDEITKSRERCL